MSVEVLETRHLRSTRRGTVLVVVAWAVVAVLAAALVWAIPRAADSRHLLRQTAAARRELSAHRQHTADEQRALEAVGAQLAAAQEQERSLSDRFASNAARLETKTALLDRLRAGRAAEQAGVQP